MPCHNFNNFIIYPDHVNLHPILLHTSHSSAHLDPYIYAHPFEANTPISLPRNSYGHHCHNTVTNVASLVTSVETAPTLTTVARGHSDVGRIDHRMRGYGGEFSEVQQVNSMPPLSSYNIFTCLQVDTIMTS
jgi:hypothetical protein